MLLQEQSFGSGLHTQSYNVWDWFHQQLNVSQFNAQEIEAQ